MRNLLAMACMLVLPPCGVIRSQIARFAPAAPENSALVPPPGSLDPAGSLFGASVQAGDIDGDGIDEMVIGAPGIHGRSADAGAVFVFRGSDHSLMADLRHPNPPVNRTGAFGSALLCHDLDLDGFADIVATCASREGATPGYYVFFGPDLARWTSFAHPLLGGEGATERANVALGDLNGDGFLDIVYGNPFVHDSLGNRGAFFVCYGPDLVQTTWVFRPTALSDFFAYAVAVGDSNADGYDDVLVTDPWADRQNGLTQQGRAWLYFGPDFVARKSFVNPTLVANRQYGFNCAMGDFNGDGFFDVAIGAPRSIGVSGAGGDGMAHVYWGPTLDGSIRTDLVNGPSDLWGGELGREIVAGDVNGDGIEDLLVSAPFRGYVAPSGDLGGGELNVFYGPNLDRERLLAPVLDSLGGWAGSVALGEFTSDEHTDILSGMWAFDQNNGRAFITDLSAKFAFTTYQAPFGSVPRLRLVGSGVPRPGQRIQLRMDGVPERPRIWLWSSVSRAMWPLSGSFDDPSRGRDRYLLLAPPLTLHPVVWLPGEEAPRPEPVHSVGCQFDVPLDPTLVGLRMRFQAFAYEPADPLGLLESNGLVVTVGGMPSMSSSE